MSLILNGTDGLSDVDGTAGTPAIRGTDANTGIFFPAADTIAFSEGGVEAMRIDSSGNVGIGTTSPACSLDVTKSTDSGSTFPRLQVLNSLATQGNGSTTFNYARFDARSGNGTVVADFGTRYDSYVGGFLGTETNHPIFFQTNGTERMRITSDGKVGIGTTNPSGDFTVSNGGANGFEINPTEGSGASNKVNSYNRSTSAYTTLQFDVLDFRVGTGSASAPERMRINSSGNVFIGKTADNDNAGTTLFQSGYVYIVRSSGTPLDINRLTDDGTLIGFYQATALEGSISVSGSTVSYNGGHLSRWSQWQNQTGKPEVYRGSVLESTNDMCEWNQANEQATKTIVSTTAKSKTVAGVFDMYDTDDKDSPYDFYVAQSGDFVIRISQGVVVENGDLLESAGDGTAKPQTDDICRSSTIAKVTSNYVSTTYADGSYCVPCILMIG
jgi:hypothetical protein